MASLFLTLFDGAIRTDENLEMAQLLRRKSKLLVAFGACAQGGGVPALSNLCTSEEHMATLYGRRTRRAARLRARARRWRSRGGAAPSPLPRTRAVPRRGGRGRLRRSPAARPSRTRSPPLSTGSSLVPAPLPPRGHGARRRRVERLRRVRPHSRGEAPDGLSAVCGSSSPTGPQCLLDQGLPCLGLATRSGCGALCPAVNMPCTGCYGAPEGVYDQPARFLGAVASTLDTSASRAAAIPARSPRASTSCSTPSPTPREPRASTLSRPVARAGRDHRGHDATHQHRSGDAPRGARPHRDLPRRRGGRRQRLLPGAGAARLRALLRRPARRGHARPDQPDLRHLSRGPPPRGHQGARRPLRGRAPPPAARKLRELLYMAFFVADHTTHFYVLGGPDFIVGPDAPPSERNLLGVIRKLGADVGRAGDRLPRAQPRGHPHPRAAAPSTRWPGLPGGWSQRPVRGRTGQTLEPHRRGQRQLRATTASAPSTRSSSRTPPTWTCSGPTPTVTAPTPWAPWTPSTGPTSTTA